MHRKVRMELHQAADTRNRDSRPLIRSSPAIPRRRKPPTLKRRATLHNLAIPPRRQGSLLPLPRHNYQPHHPLRRRPRGPPPLSAPS
jgi:hypothetical protein